eukprot:6195519-Pleurochrysis_carterae.AAC.3
MRRLRPLPAVQPAASRLLGTWQFAQEGVSAPKAQQPAARWMCFARLMRAPLRATRTCARTCLRVHVLEMPVPRVCRHAHARVDLRACERSEVGIHTLASLLRCSDPPALNRGGAGARFPSDHLRGRRRARGAARLDLRLDRRRAMHC